jgi:hypothetical protein
MEGGMEDGKAFDHLLDVFSTMAFLEILYFPIFQVPKCVAF